MLNRKIEKLHARFGGIRKMHRLPDLIFIVDVRREETAVREANTLGIPIVALVDTNCDPRDIDYVIPSNDDAIRTIKLMVGFIADAVLEGKAMRKDEDLEELPSAPIAEGDEELSDAELLGESTLAKMEAAAEATVEEETAEPEVAEVEVEETDAEEESAEEADENEEEE
jgi:small subunit ribosomal protein S2